MSKDKKSVDEVWSAYQIILKKENKVKLLEQYKDIVDKSAIVSKTNVSGIITYANSKFCEISGYSEEELIGKPHNIVRHSDMPQEAFKNLWETIQSGKSWFGKVKNRKKNGDFYHVDTVINPIINNHGEIIEYIAIRHDITELEQYKDLLKNELNTKNKNIEENINYLKQYEEAIGSVVAVLKTDTDNIITYANPRFCELMGYSLDDLVGISCAELRDEEHQIMLDCDKIKDALKNKKAMNRLLTNITKNGNKLHFSTLFFPVADLHSNIIEHLQIMHDVSDIVSLNSEIISTQKEIVTKMGQIVEHRSQEMGFHVKRVAEYSKELALLAGLSEEDADLLYSASPMHDIGKVGIPDSILMKPGPLDASEWLIMKTHAEAGYYILNDSSRPILKAAATISHTHHEKWDGSGYPNAIAGEDIHIFGRITAIADVFDALGSDRVYKKAWKIGVITDYIREESAKHFDPMLVDIFLKNIDKFLDIKHKYVDSPQN
ncbi:MAG: PAS domain S-box-containing protein [Sulfurimonas sp.]|jgi:PAS domain S-box-containing protein